MDKVSQFVSVNANLAKSAHIERDNLDRQALKTYVITSNANQALNDTINACANSKNSNKAFSIVGPYGSGKSSFIIYLSHLLSNNNTAIQKLATPLKKQFKQHLSKSSGYCKILISGTPESLIHAFLKALKLGITPYYQQLKIDPIGTHNTVDKLLSFDEVNIKKVINLVKKIRIEIQNSGGAGLLIVIDELGKFLEYSARHESNDIFLLQVLAEETYKTDKANILLFVLLHQSFEQYGKNLDNKLKNEWIKIQGRYQTLSFVDTATELLPIVAQVFQQKIPDRYKKKITNNISDITKSLKEQNILPTSLQEDVAGELFTKCYPLHPLTLLLLPVLCQKIAQNERTLFNYLGSAELFSLTSSMQDLSLGEFIYPSDLYNYFMKGESLSNDFATIRALSEAYTALDKASDASLSEVNILKTVALFNIANSNIVASKNVLALCDVNYLGNIKKLLTKSVITYRRFSGEYRIWQGSDFDINQAINEQLAQLTTLNIAEYINQQQVFLPFVAKKYSIKNHSLFYFEAVFIHTNQYKNTEQKGKKPRVIFCLKFNSIDQKIFIDEVINYFDKQDICVLVGNSNNIKVASQYCAALKNIANQNTVIEQDPVIAREFNQYFIDAKQKEQQHFNQVLIDPKISLWYNQKQEKQCKTKRAVQGLFSQVLQDIYPDTPIIRNELINRDNPSAQANSGRRKLLLQLLNHHDKENLAIEKYPAEKSMYLAILKNNGMHANTKNGWKIQAPTDAKFLKVWQIIDDFLSQSSNQARNLSELDAILTTPPFGIKKPVLPIFYIANFLYNKDEIALYEDRIYVPYFTDEHLERFLKRPDTFTFQQFKIEGFNQSLMQEYEDNLLSKKPKNAQAIFSAIASFIKELSTYTKQTSNISPIAQAVRDAFKNNKSPQDLLFRKLPEVCGFSEKETDGFGETLKQALQEIKNAYSIMLNQQVRVLAEKLNIENREENKGKIKTKLVEYGQNLQAYTIDAETTKFIKIIGENYGDIDRYFERILMSINNKNPKEWTDTDSDFAKQKLSENIKLVINLEKVRSYHLQDELVDPTEMAIVDNIVESIETLSSKAKIRVINKAIKDISMQIEDIKND